ncbi:MAG: hypothetical protein A2X82_11625 [Geobacteraceae bacterium GWC2_55_20]|nr:MAG: hypothetical protein A2X82_11625 [Geobacteraceae bacterium GWC2_55_20]OGU23355.1 MAG: hypothetical protein A2X85_17790 [Geobacteraceae bacterium GWF2_54_21]HCE66863.1 hypothetical protein [Geobacter sp.]
MSDTNDSSAPGLKLQSQPDLLKAALEYASRGIPIFPLGPQGKLSIVKWGSEATTDPEQIKAWWQQNPNYNIGLLTGAKSGIAVVDFDSREALARGKELGLPDGPTVKTGRGFHLYCQQSEGTRNFQKRSDLPETDLRAEGGYVVAPPSIHENGEQYSWFICKGLDDLPLPPLPEWILAKTPEEKTPVKSLITGVPEGQRNNALARLVGSWLHENVSYKDVIIKAKEWNNQNTPPLDDREVLKTIDSIYKRERGNVPTGEFEWGEPILFDGIDVEEITADLLPSWLGDYSRAVSKSTQTSEALAVMVGLSAIATCVQKKIVVSPNRNDYVEPLCIWTVSVLPSSERKTPVFKAMTAPIYAWEKEQAQLLEAQIAETNSIRHIEQKRIDNLRQKAVSATDSAERERLIQEIGAIHAAMPDEVRAPRLWVGDTTAETLQDLLADNNEKMAVLADEGVIFEIMAGLYSDSKVNIDIFLQSYSGSPTRIERKSRSASLENPALTFGITVQPSVIESLGMGSKKALRGKGALGRFLFCFPQSMMGKRDPRNEYQVPLEVKLAYQQGIQRLLNIRDNFDDEGALCPIVLKLESDALERWHEFSEYVEEQLGPDGELALMTDWGGKLPGNALRVAGLMHLVDQGPENDHISSETMENALELCSLLVSHAKMAFDIVGTDETISGAKKIYNWMQRNKFEGFSKTTCLRSLHMSADKMDKPLKVLEDRDIIRSHKIDTGGRASNCYEVNPILKHK